MSKPLNDVDADLLAIGSMTSPLMLIMLEQLVATQQIFLRMNKRVEHLERALVDLVDWCNALSCVDQTCPKRWLGRDEDLTDEGETDG